MTGLLTILILLGITIAIWQMVKIFDLAQANKDNSQIANDKEQDNHTSFSGHVLAGTFLVDSLFLTFLKFCLRSLRNEMSKS